MREQKAFFMFFLIHLVPLFNLLPFEHLRFLYLFWVKYVYWYLYTASDETIT